MIVYGDPGFDVGLHAFSAALHDAVCKAAAAPASLAHARELLVWAGQLEQGVADALDGAGVAPRRRASLLAQYATRAAAAAFYRTYAATEADPRASWRRCARALALLQRTADVSVRLKSPEGFSHYGLFPEQYVDAAHAWLDDHPLGEVRRIAVVGLRSIGTTLAAVVTTVLSCAGRQVRTCTVRPGGHPYARAVDADAAWARGAVHAIIVDEGPGLSGSSMAAVAQWLARADVRAVSVFPSHAHGPGVAASDATRAWWERVPCYVGEARCDVARPYIAQYCAAVFADDPVATVEDMSGGMWRRHVYSREDEWPAACAALERPKYRCTLRSGRRVLMKFCGFDASPQPASGAQRAAERMKALGVDVISAGDGFVFVGWTDEAPAELRHASEAPSPLARHLARSAFVPLSEEALARSWECLSALVHRNVGVALGDARADEAARHFERVKTRPLSPALRRACVDARMAPQEWRVANDGAWRKVSAAGAIPDVSAVGEQPLLWDLAGAAVEWKLHGAARDALFDAYFAACGERVDEECFECYRLAYAAYRAGACKLCLEMHARGDPERRRLEEAYENYRAQIESILERASAAR